MKTSPRTMILLLVVALICSTGLSQTRLKPAKSAAINIDIKRDQLSILAGLIRAERKAGFIQCEGGRGTVFFCGPDSRHDAFTLRGGPAGVVTVSAAGVPSRGSNRRRLVSLLAALKTELETRYQRMLKDLESKPKR